MPTQQKTIAAHCPSCGCERATPTGVLAVQVCVRCGCLHGTCYRGESYTLVKPGMKDGDLSVCRAFDLVVLGGSGLERRHGYYDPSDRQIVQVG